MALMTPVFLLLMTGIFSLSMATYQKLLLAEAVSVGARQLAVDRGDTDPCATIASYVYNAAPTLSTSKLSLSFVLDGVSYNNTATCTSGATNMVAGKEATLTATYPCVLQWYGMGPTSCSLAVSTSEVIQ
jgi:Flp pilus assembly protein TadG